jgi:hypothetical protein
MNLQNSLTADGRLYVILYDDQGEVLADGTFDTGEEAITAARMFLEQMETEQDGPESTDETREISLPG